MKNEDFWVDQRPRNEAAFAGYLPWARLWERETLSQLLDLRDVAISGPVEGIWGDVERQSWFYYCCDLGHRARADDGGHDPSSLVVGMGTYIGVHRQLQSKETTQAEAAGTRRHFWKIQEEE